MSDIPSANVEAIGCILNDTERPLKDRFRALFTLRNLGGHQAIDAITRSFSDSSALLKHELAYVLGQMQDEYALPVLISVLKDYSQEAMVRHEAGEAMGAIGSTNALDVLQEFLSDPVIEVAETCQLAKSRIEWLHNQQKEDDTRLSTNPYRSVDPAPPSEEQDVQALKSVLLDESLPLFQRYRAMFSLRNICTEDAIKALAEGLKCKSALFRHEVAFVLGQTQHKAGVDQLVINLQDKDENMMVRHESAEALGSIATDRCVGVLKDYLKDEERVVKESCLVALDISEFENSEHFQYADTLSKVC